MEGKRKDVCKGKIHLLHESDFIDMQGNTARVAAGRCRPGQPCVHATLASSTAALCHSALICAIHR